MRHIVLLEDIERIEAAFFHDRAQQLLQAAVQLLAAVATHDAGLLAVGDGDVAVEEPVLAFGEHQLSLAQPDADLPLRGVAHAAGIDQPVALHRRHDAFLVRRHGRLDGAAQAHLVGHELLGLAQYDLDRTLGHVRQQGGGHGGVQHRLLVAVAAADVEGIHVDLRAGNVCLHHELHDVRALRGSPHGVVLVAVVAHDHGRRLGGQGARHLGERDLVLGDEIRFGDGLVGIAPLHLPERAVGLEIRAARVDQVARETLIQLRSAFLQGIRGRENRRKLLVLDLDQIDRLVRDLLRLGGDDRDLIAYVEDLGLEHEAMHRPAEAGQERRVLVRDDGAHAFERFGLGGIDLHDARVRIRAPLRPADQHVGKREVVEKERLAGDELPRFLARRVFADVAVVRLPDIAVFHRSFPA